MLALRSKIASYAMAGAMVFSASWNVDAQTLPSQRYRPTQPSAQAPPSVHVPPARMRSMGSTAGYTLSDSSLRDDLPRTAYHRNVIQQTSYAAPDQPEVPEILRRPGANNQAASPENRKSQRIAPAVASDVTAPAEPRKTPDHFAAAMSQVRGNSLKVAPAELNTPSTTARTVAPAVHPNLDDADANGLRGSRPAAVAASHAPTSKISASDFVRQISAKSERQPTVYNAPVEDRNTAPAASPIAASDASSDLRSSRVAPIGQITERSIEANQIRQVSAENYVNETEDASIRLDAPALSVETFGPQTIGVNKPAVYQVKVHNASHTDAERILVGLKLPSWVDVDHVNLTAGGKEITDGKDRARVVWNIDRIPAKGSQTITVTAIPRKAEMFDVGVEWTLVPRVGKANVTVTEPRLEMSIAGPSEVQFGEKALYHVTVRNPGTGTAENVGVKLPESLGGEPALLGNIEPGKEKNFQVELLARTAGDLSLEVTANAEGNLTASADRKLIVRRANLGIALQGPALKYAGSIGRYKVTLTNTGDAVASDVMTAVALPPGVKFLGGVDSVVQMDGGVRWHVGSIAPGKTKSYEIDCQMDASGDLQLEVGARDLKGKGDLAASSACLTTVETVADLVLSVADPKGPLPTGEEVTYTINVRNRGSRSAKAIDLVMQFSEGIEPHTAQGQEHQIVPGQVLFSPIRQIDPGQQVSFKVTAQAFKSGTHVFRAQLTCDESDAREIAEGTTRFFGDSMPETSTANSDNSFGGEPNDFTR